MRLNLGCGRDVRQGWVNVDIIPAEGVHFADLNDPEWDVQLHASVTDCDEKTVEGWDVWEVAEYTLASHVIEHLTHPLHFMEGLWRLTKPGGVVEVACPFGSSDDAFEDPTHVRNMFIGSFGYFGQPYYWQADYGYRGDWRIQKMKLTLMEHMGYSEHTPIAQIMNDVRHLRNVVGEMIVIMEAVKPIREPRRELQEKVDVEFGIPQRRLTDRHLLHLADKQFERGGQL